MQTLIDRFKQFRRVKKDRSLASAGDKVVQLPKPQLHLRQLELGVPIGEDKTSFQRHNKTIKAELKKSKGGNPAVVRELMT